MSRRILGIVGLLVAVAALLYLPVKDAEAARRQNGGCGAESVQAGVRSETVTVRHRERHHVRHERHRRVRVTGPSCGAPSVAACATGTCGPTYAPSCAAPSSYNYNVAPQPPEAPTAEPAPPPVPPQPGQ